MVDRNVRDKKTWKVSARFVAVAAAAALGLSACGGGSGGEGESETLLLGHGANPDNPRSVAADFFAEEVAARTEGGVEVQIQGAEQLGSDAEMLVSMTSGTLQMSANSQGTFSSHVPEAALFGLPFLFDDVDHAYSVVDGPIGDEIAALAEDAGFKVLAWWDNGMRDITNSKRPINSPADVEGLKIRTPEDPMTIDIFEALGANPTPMAFNELYLALQQGAVDGQENPVANIHANALHEVQGHLAKTGHKYEVTPLVISMTAWEGLSEDEQTALQDAADAARDLQREEMKKVSDELYTELADSMELTEPDLSAFREATSSVYDKWGEEYPELVEQLQAEADAGGTE